MFDFIRRLMYGRYGNDELGQSLMIAGLIVAALWSFLRIDALAYILLVLLFICYYRILSRDIGRRRAENERFLQWWKPKKKMIMDARLRFRDRKMYRYYRCKSCKTYLRVPRGKGRINIKCPKCGNEFVKKV